MAVETITIGELVARVSFAIRNDTNAGTALSTEIKWCLDSAVTDFLNEFDHPAFQMDGTITVVSGTSDYDLADDFQRVVDGTVRYSTGDKLTLSRIHESQWHRSQQDRFGAGSTSYPRCFDLIGRSQTTGAQLLRLFPEPSAGATIAYKYIGTPSARDASTDAVVAIKNAADADILDRRWPPEMHQYIVESVIARYMAQHVSQKRLQQAAAWIKENSRNFKKKAQTSIGHDHQQGGFGFRGGRPYYVPGTLVGVDLPPS